MNSIDDKNVGAYYLRGTALEKLGMIDEAIEAYSTVLMLDADHVNATFSRASCLNLKVFKFFLILL